ncbi:hypothetical protein FS842_003751 [Serendipita sp. 407]|nr:hypothetical protein FS842_003751 [Serendipita sp. 407]
MPITLPHSIIHIFDDVNLTRYVSAVGFTILVYDSLLTLGNEVRLLWFERWTFVKTLFYLVRLSSLSLFFCADTHTLLYV